MDLSTETLESLKKILSNNVYNMFLELDVLDSKEKADLEILGLLEGDVDPAIVKVICLNGLQYCLYKLVDKKYQFTPEDVECLKQNDFGNKFLEGLQKCQEVG